MSDENNEDKFKEAVRGYLEVDNEIKKFNKQVKDLRDEKKQLEVFMIEYMENTALDEVLVTDGKLSLNKKSTKQALKKEYVQSRIETYTKSTEQAVQITEDIWKNRPTTEKVEIKRSGIRKKRQKKQKK